MTYSKNRKIIKEYAKHMIARQPDDQLANRAALLNLMRSHSKDGKVAIIYGGTDCDGMQYDGMVHIVPAVLSVVECEVGKLWDAAEGQFRWSLYHPHRARKLAMRNMGLVSS